MVVVLEVDNWYSFWLKYKLDYGVIMKYEHVNSFEKIYRSLSNYFLIKK